MEAINRDSENEKKRGTLNKNRGTLSKQSPDTAQKCRRIERSTDKSLMNVTVQICIFQHYPTETDTGFRF